MECMLNLPIVDYACPKTATSDIDFEYPSTAAQGQGLADLVTALRTAFTQLQSRKGDAVPYLISAAVGAGPAGYTYLNVPQMNAAMDYWNLMVSTYILRTISSS